MNKQFLIRVIQLTVITLTAAAIAQELSKPPEQRKWNGKVLGFIPYEFRPPVLDRIRESYWNPYERHILTPTILGIGWAVNFYALFENLGLIRQIGPSEESFLMPNKRMREILRQDY